MPRGFYTDANYTKRPRLQSTNHRASILQSSTVSGSLPQGVWEKPLKAPSSFRSTRPGERRPHDNKRSARNSRFDRDQLHRWPRFRPSLVLGKGIGEILDSVSTNVYRQEASSSVQPPKQVWKLNTQAHHLAREPAPCRIGGGGLPWAGEPFPPSRSRWAKRPRKRCGAWPSGVRTRGERSSHLTAVAPTAAPVDRAALL